MTTKTRKNKHWSQEELDYLEYHYGMKTTTEIGKKLGRTAASVRVAANTRGFKLQGQQKYAVYDGDDLKVIGTQEACMEFLDLTYVGFHSMKAPSYAERSKTGIRIIDLGMWRIDEDE